MVSASRSENGEGCSTSGGRLVSQARLGNRSQVHGREVAIAVMHDHGVDGICRHDRQQSGSSVLLWGGILEVLCGSERPNRNRVSSSIKKYGAVVLCGDDV